MTHKHDTLSIDERLAQFTDQLLEGDIKDASGADTELKAFAETVQSLHTVFDEEIDSNKAEEIRKKVMVNWLHTPNTKNRAQTKRKSWFSWTSQRSFSMAASMAMILILLVLAPALLTSTPIVTGSAGIFSQKTLFLVILGFFLAVALVWALRKKQ